MAHVNNIDTLTTLITLLAVHLVLLMLLPVHLLKMLRVHVLASAHFHSGMLHQIVNSSTSLLILLGKTIP